MIRRRHFVGLGTLLFGVVAAGCIGTDLVDDLETATGMAYITVTPLEQATLVGETALFEATYYDAFGMEHGGAAFTWHTGDASIATIDVSGSVTTHMTGQVTIWAMTDSLASPMATLTVLDNPNQVARVAVMPDSVALSPGETQSFTARAFNLDGDEVAISSITWTVDDEVIAEIDAQGVATARIGGLAHITATVDDVTSRPARLRVLGQQRSGTFTPREGTGYNVEGTATLEERADGSLVLRFGDDFEVSSGPDIEVFLSSSNTVNASSLSLGDVKQLQGEQSYDVPSSIDLYTYDWVIIHCVPFNVTFGYAELERQAP